MVDLKQIEGDILPKVEEVIKKILDSKDEADRKKALENAFEQSNIKLNEASSKITELTDLITAKDAEVESLKEMNDSLKKEHATLLETAENAASEKIKVLELAVEGKDSEISKITEELKVAKASLDEIESNAKALNRIEVLKASGVAYSKEDAAKSQFSKVKGMSDEEFDAYKGELELLAEQIKAVASEKINLDSGVTPPPEIPAGGATDAKLNLETASVGVDSANRIKELGNVMAKMMRNISGEDTGE